MWHNYQINNNFWMMCDCQLIEWIIIQGVMVCVIYGAQVITQLMLFIVVVTNFKSLLLNQSCLSLQASCKL